MVFAFCLYVFLVFDPVLVGLTRCLSLASYRRGSVFLLDCLDTCLWPLVTLFFSFFMCFINFVLTVSPTPASPHI